MATRGLLQGIPEPDDVAQRHLWLRCVFDALRGSEMRVPEVLARVDALVEQFNGDPVARDRLRALWRQIDRDMDLAAVLAEFGFAWRSMFMAELGHRLVAKVLPTSPVTSDPSELFALVLHDPRDALWVGAMSPRQVQAVAALVRPLPHESVRQLGDDGSEVAASSARASPGFWQSMALRALSHCIGQIGASGFRADLRQRMSRQARRTDCFEQIPVAFQALMHAVRTGQDMAACVGDLRFLLVEAQWCGVSVYEHLQEHGISVEVVYQLRQLRWRVERAHQLLDLVASSNPERTTVGLIAALVRLGAKRRSVRALVADSVHLTSARVAERTAETGEHYITRDAAQYRHMLTCALGGGAFLGLTTWAKFLIGGMSLSLFWAGATAGMNYALSFVAMHLLHLIVATKQPAMTAPAMVAKLRVLDHPASVFRFVDEVVHLIRSQMAAIAGNLVAVIPAVVLINLVLIHLSGAGMLDPAKARSVFGSSQLLGPSVLFAAFTGVLLFASSIVGGWMENWFVLNRLDSAVAYHPRVRRSIGADRARRLGNWLLGHVGALSASVCLGLMLGLAPVFAQFF